MEQFIVNTQFFVAFVGILCAFGVAVNAILEHMDQD